MCVHAYVCVSACVSVFVCVCVCVCVCVPTHHPGCTTESPEVDRERRVGARGAVPAVRAGLERLRAVLRAVQPAATLHAGKKL